MSNDQDVESKLNLNRIPMFFFLVESKKRIGNMDDVIIKKVYNTPYGKISCCHDSRLAGDTYGGVEAVVEKRAGK